MVSAFELYVGGVAVLYVLLLAAVVYYDASSGTRFRRRLGTSPAAAVAAGTVGCVVAVGLAVAGRLPPWLDVGSRGAVFALVLLAAPLVAGCVGCAVVYGNGRTLRRLRRSGATPLADVGPGRAVLAGTAEPLGDAGRPECVDSSDDAPRSPLFGRPALCWQWRIAARNWGGSDDDRFHTVRSGGGGVPFALTDETGSLRIDPADASLDLSADRVEETPAETLPEGADPTAFDVSWSLPGDRWRHGERVLEPGTTATVLGEVSETADGPVVAGGDPFVVASGGPDAVRRRCRARLRVGAFVAVAGVVLGTWLLVATFAVSI